MLPLLLLLSTCLVRAETPQTMESEPMITTRVRLPYYSLGPAPFPMSIDHLDFQLFGDAHIDKGSLRLTDAVQSQRGAVWSKSPVQSNNWQVDLRFQVGGSPNLEHFGDGFAFWVVKERGVVGEALGGPDEFTGLGVFFDTFKNENFRSKKHPWIYGKFNAETGSYKSITENAHPPINACHAPFRNADPKILATTVARITLMNGILSVVMRPKGAIDWIQCFEIPNVQFPTTHEYYIGVTAMTGGLIDNHHFLQLTMYGNVDVQPFAYSHAYKITQMPDMWRAMAESGKIAREFEDWEELDSFSDDLKWTVDRTTAHANDDYDDEYKNSDDDEEGEDEDEPYRVYSDEEEAEDEEEDGESYGGNNDGSGKAALSQAVMEIMQRPVISEKLQRKRGLNQDLMQNVHVQMERRMQEVTDQMHRAARELRVKEHALSLRILDLGQRLKVSVTDPFESVVEQQKGGWFWPFVLFVLLIAGTAFFGYSRYKKFMKQHLL